MFDFVSRLSEPISLAMLGIALSTAAFLVGRTRSRQSAPTNADQPFRVGKEPDAV
jgi:hypothetical protein